MQVHRVANHTATNFRPSQMFSFTRGSCNAHAAKRQCKELSKGSMLRTEKPTPTLGKYLRDTFSKA
jgi:hypothetical protein